MAADTHPPLRPFSLVGQTLRLLFAQFGFLFPLAFVPSLILSVLAYATGSGAQPDDATGMPAVSGAYIVTFLIDILVGFVVTGVMCLAAIDAVIGKRHTIREYLSQTMRHIGPIIALGALLYVIAGIGIALLVIPGLYILARFLPWIAAIVFEDAGWSGLSRAQELTEGYRWPLAAAIALFAVLGVAVAFALAPFIALGTSVGPILLLPVEAAATAIFYALVAIFTALVYARLREIRDGMTAADIAASID